MATTSREAELRLRLLTFQKDINDAKARFDTMKRGLDDLVATAERADDPLRETAKATLTIEQAAEKLNNELRDIGRQKGLQELAKQAREGRIEARQLAEELSKVGASDSEIRRVAQNSLAPEQVSGAERLRQAGRELRSLPAVGIPGTSLSTDVLGNTARVLGAVGVSFTQLLAVAAPVAIGIGIVGVAMDVYTRQLAEHKRALAGALQGEEAYSQAVLNSTTDEATRRLEQLTREREQLEGRLTAARQRVDSSFTQEVQARSQQLTSVLGPTGAGFADLTARLLDNQGPVSQLRESYEELDQRQAQINTEIALYTAGLDENVFATNDAREATEAAAEAERRLAAERNRLASFALGVELRSRQQSRSMSSEDAQTQLTDFEFERDQLRQFGEDTKETTLRLTELNTEIYQLQAVTIPAIEAREREEAAAEHLQQMIDAVTESSEQQAEAERKLSDAKQDIIDEEAESARKIAQIQDDLRFKVDEALYARGDDLNEAARKAEMERSELIREANRDRLKVEQDYVKAVKRLHKESLRDQDKAVQERNAVALDAARTERDDQREAIQERLDEQIDTISDRYSEANRKVDLSLKEQNRQIERKYNDQLRLANLNAQRSIEAEKARAQGQLTILTGSYNTQLQLTANWATKTIALTNQVAAAANALSNQVKKPNFSYYTAYGDQKSTTASPISPIYRAPTLQETPGYAGGGKPPLFHPVNINEEGMESGLSGGRLAVFTRPTHIFTAQQTQSLLNGGRSLTLNLRGAVNKTIDIRSRAQAEEIVGWALDQLGA